MSLPPEDFRPAARASFPDMRAAVRMHRPIGPAWARSINAVERYRRAVRALSAVRRAIRGGHSHAYAEALVTLERCCAELEAAARDAALARGDAKAEALHAARGRHFDAWAEARAEWINGPLLRRARQAADAAVKGGEAPKPTNMRDAVLDLVPKYAQRDQRQVAALIAERLKISPHTVRRHLREASSGRMSLPPEDFRPAARASFPDMRAAVRMHRPIGPAWARSTNAVERYRRAVRALSAVRRAIRGGHSHAYAEALVTLDLCCAELEAAAYDAALARGDVKAKALHAARGRHFDAWAKARAEWINGPLLRRARQAADAAVKGGEAPKPTNMRDAVLDLVPKYAQRDQRQVAALIAERLKISPHTVRRHLREARKADSK